MDENENGQNYSLLAAFARCHHSYDERKKAADALLEIAGNSIGKKFKFVELCTNILAICAYGESKTQKESLVPEGRAVFLGSELLKIYAAQGSYLEVSKLADNAKLPAKLREMAAEAFDGAGVAYIEQSRVYRFSDPSFIEELESLVEANNPKMPRTVAMARVELELLGKDNFNTSERSEITTKMAERKLKQLQEENIREIEELNHKQAWRNGTSPQAVDMQSVILHHLSLGDAVELTDNYVTFARSASRRRAGANEAGDKTPTPRPIARGTSPQ